MINIILKVDDFWGKESNKFFIQKAIDLRIKISLGVVGKGLETASNDLVDLIKNNLDLIEPFNHSYNHFLEEDTKEFLRTPIEYQRESIAKTNEVVRRRLGFEMRTIGFVANATDHNTIDLMREFDFDNIYYVEGSYNYDDMVKTGKKIINIGDKNNVFQIHPFSWSEEQTAGFFEGLLEGLRLKGEDYQFIFPSEYAK